MSLYRNLILAILAILSCHAKAQFQGHVYDSQTRQPLEGVTIITTHGLLAQTNRNGRFKLDSANVGDTILVRLIGFKNQVVRLNQQQDLNIQLESDAVRLNEVRVNGFDGNKTKRETAGAIALITAEDITRGNTVSIQSALNSVPGVRMEQSTLSEARISIRGNGVRSSFGLRNIKVYLNEIPVTEADGTTRIEALDVNSIGRAEIIRGPASSVYGAGTGGVINFQLQRSPYQEQSIEASALSGSYGLKRFATTYRSGADKLNSFVSYGLQEFDGYRQHSNDTRKFLTGNFQLFPSENRIVTLLINRTSQKSQIPGSLTQEQVLRDPVQANATNLDKAAARYQNWTRIGLGQRYRFSDKLYNNSSIFTYFYDLNHPLPFAYIRNFYQSYGGRSKFTYAPDFSVLPTTFTVGAEYNEALTKGAQYVNNKGFEGALTSNNDFQNTSYSFFYQSETALSTKTELTLGLSYNTLRYHVKDYLKPNQSGIKKFNPQASPRVAISHNFNETISVHASLSSGFSPPASSEIKNVDGSINPSLQAEKGMNYELNVKGNLLKSRLSYDLAVFKLDMKGELIGQSIQQGITIYNNSGKTVHNGMELALSWQALSEGENKIISSLRPYAAITYSDFKFEDYKLLNAQNQVSSTYDGNELTGIAPWVINAGIDLVTEFGIYFNGTYFFSDKLPLNDANTAYNSSYQLVTTKIGYRRRFSNSLELNLYGGIDNLLNQSFSSIISLNASGFNGAQPAYFNPSPTRNGYGGLNFKFLF